MKLALTVLKSVRTPLPAEAVLEKWVRAALERPAELTLAFVGEKKGRTLNGTYRGKDGPTNVLTFDYAHEPVALADIALCVPVVQKEARAQGKSFEAHLAHLVVHGVLHAQGYDHATDGQARLMEGRETQVMRKLGFPDPYSDAPRAH